MPITGDRHNSVLAAIPADDWERIRPSLREVRLTQGDVLFDADAVFDRVVFPYSGTISMVATFADGASVETANVGPEGLLSVGAIFGSRSAPTRHVVQLGGRGAVMDYAVFRRFKQDMPGFRAVLFRYLQAFFVQSLQSTACNAVHAVPARAARWLLTCQDRTGEGSFAITQQTLAEMLGVSRPMLSAVARAFQRDGLISYTRGSVSIADRAGLEQVSCECYEIIRAAFETRSFRINNPVR